MCGIRVIVPKKLQEDVLKELHRDHQGIARMNEGKRQELPLVARSGQVTGVDRKRLSSV